MKVHQRKEEDWDAIYDAETLARAEIINNDPDRLKKARAWAKKLADEEKKEADAMKKVASS